jgi:CRP-like cAMP-binding protein
VAVNEPTKGDPVTLSPSKIRSSLLTHIQKHLNHANFHVTFPTYIIEAEQETQPLNWYNDRMILLQKVSLFKHVPHEILQQLAEMLHVITFDTDQQVIHEGDKGDSMFIVAEGALKVYTYHNDKEVYLTSMLSEDFFGEFSLLTGEVRSANICAITSTVCYEINHKIIHQLFSKYPQEIDQLSIALNERILERSTTKSEFKMKYDQIQMQASSPLSIADKIRHFLSTYD